MRSRVDLLREPVKDGKRIAIARDSLDRLMRLGIFDNKLKMQRLTAFLEVSMDELGRAGRVRIAYCANLDGDGGGSDSQELICHDARSDRGDPV